MAKSVFEKVEAEQLVMEYRPRKFPLRIEKQAHEFIAFSSQNPASGFRIDPIVSQQTGVSELERMSMEEKVEREALARLKDVQEEAYRAAHQLGLEEGKKLAFDEKTAELSEKIEHMQVLLTKIENLKKELVVQNESAILRLIYYIAGRVAMSEIQSRPEVIVDVLRKATESMQEDENVSVHLAPADLQFIEGSREQLGKSAEFIRRLKLEADEKIKPGGCVIETNYGVVDASVEQRLNKFWEAISEKLPKVKKEVGDA